MTSSRPAALADSGWRHRTSTCVTRGSSTSRSSGICAPRQELAGDDLTYVAPLGLLAPPALPRTLVADLAGAERAATTAVALLLACDRGGARRYAEVALEDAAEFVALPRTHGVTAEGRPLGGGDCFYGLYEARAG